MRRKGSTSHNGSIMRPLLRRSVDPLAPRVVRGHSGALPHGSAAGHGFGAALALPATSGFTDERSPHCRSDQRERLPPEAFHMGAWRDGCSPLRSHREQAGVFVARERTWCITSHGCAGEERRRWRRTWLQAGSVTYAGAAVGIGDRGESRSHEHRKRVGSSRTFDITDRVGRGAGSALLSRTPRDHVRCTGIAASEWRSHEQAGNVGTERAVDITRRVALGMHLGFKQDACKVRGHAQGPYDLNPTRQCRVGSVDQSDRFGWVDRSGIGRIVVGCLTQSTAGVRSV